MTVMLGFHKTPRFRVKLCFDFQEYTPLILGSIIMAFCLLKEDSGINNSADHSCAQICKSATKLLAASLKINLLYAAFYHSNLANLAKHVGKDIHGTS